MALAKFAKKGKRVISRAYKKRYVRKGKTNYLKMVQDIAYLKNVLNPEKKRYQLNYTDNTVSQSFGDVSALWCRDITPTPAQGITAITRNGNSIKPHSVHLKFQFQQQSATTSRITFDIYIVRIMGTPIAQASIASTMFLPNSFITGGSIIDLNSDRNDQTFKYFRILKKKRVVLHENENGNQQMIKTTSMGLKFKNYHVKFASDGSQTVSDGQLAIIILADNGNSSTTTASSLNGTAQTAINTGALMQSDITFWYYDN